MGNYPRELLEYHRDITSDCSNAPSRNNEDEFVDITGITDILSKIYGSGEFSVTV